MSNLYFQTFWRTPSKRDEPEKMAVKTVVCLYCVINVKFLLELGLLIGLFSVVGSLLYVAVGFIIGSTTCWTEMVMKQNLEQP